MPSTPEPFGAQLARQLLLLLLLTSSASSQVLEWSPARVFLVNQSAGTAYDTWRERGVVFGGGNMLTPQTDTWEWDGAQWSPRPSVVRPSRRDQPAMSFDSERGVVVLFSGTAPYGTKQLVPADTWEWNGRDWRLVRPLTASPPAGDGYAMAFDGLRKKTVLYGPSADTWEWDGASWTRHPNSPGPGALRDPSLCYDPVRRTMLLFGGLRLKDYSLSAETWTWDGRTWLRQQPARSPGKRRGASLVFDRNRGRAVLFGGHDNFRRNDVWEWDGRNWTEIQAAPGPTPAWRAQSFYDAKLRRVLVFGGSEAKARANEHTWAWDGAKWQQLAPASAPDGLWPPAMAFDYGSMRALLTGDDGVNAGTWSFEGTHWKRLATSGAAGPIAWDPVRQRMMSYAGKGRSQTLEWDGTRWVSRTPARNPGPREEYTLCTDWGRRQVLLFGGHRNYKALGDTWVWDGANWTELKPKNSPGPRRQSSATFEWSRGKVLLVGGYTGSSYPADTWEWDGSNWRKLPVTLYGAEVSSAALSFDFSLQRCVLFGPNNTGRVDFDGQVWVLDGTRWKPVSFAAGPGFRSQPAMCYDRAARRMVMFGGFFRDTSLRTSLFDTWLLHDAAARVDHYGSPCSMQPGYPLLQTGVPHLGNSSFRLGVPTDSPQAPVLFGLSVGRRDQFVGPCTLHLAMPFIPLLSVANTFGFAAAPPLVIPDHRSLTGLQLHAQGIVLDPRMAGTGLTFTDGARLLLGQ